MVAVSTASTSELPSPMFTGVERIGEMVSTPGTAARSLFDGGAEAAFAPRTGVDDVVGSQ